MHLMTFALFVQNDVIMIDIFPVSLRRQDRVRLWPLDVVERENWTAKQLDLFQYKQDYLVQQYPDQMHVFDRLIEQFVRPKTKRADWNDPNPVVLLVHVQHEL